MEETNEILYIPLATREEYYAQLSEAFSATETMSSLVAELIKIPAETDKKEFPIDMETIAQHLRTLHMCQAAFELAGAILKNNLHKDQSTEDTRSEYDEEVILGSDIDSDDDADEEFEDVLPVEGHEAEVLNGQVISRIENMLNHDKEKVEDFKASAMRFGRGDDSAKDFYSHLECVMTPDIIDAIIPDFARLLKLDDRRHPLLLEHARATRRALEKNHKDIKNESKSSCTKSGTKTSSSSSSTVSSQSNFVKKNRHEEEEEEEEDATDLPPKLFLNPVNHLVFIIHGIGQHGDFRDGECKSWDGKSGLEGGNYAFRQRFQNILRSHFREIPISLEIQSIEWHEDLHGPTGVDGVFDMICPEGASGLREFNKSTLMDVLYYLSPGYGQIVIDTVTRQLNSKYKIFIETHPDWQGEITIFAHSLGSVISYDILTHEAHAVSKNGVHFPGLDFKVENFIAAGSPIPIMVLSRGDLRFEDGVFQPGMPLPNCKNFFNIYHPIDPIAYRIEPLLKPDMRGVAGAQLIQANSTRDFGFIKIHELWESIAAPTPGFNRIDYVLRQSKRQSMMELAYAATAHSAYWESDEVVLFTVLQICRPVITKLHQYTSARLPLPIFDRKRSLLNPSSTVIDAFKAIIKDTCTGLPEEKAIILEPQTLHLFDSFENIQLRRRDSIPLAGAKAFLGEDSFSLSIQLRDTVIDLKAATTFTRDEWLDAINLVIHRLKPGTVPLQNHHHHPHAHPHPHQHQHSFLQTGDYSMNYFGSIMNGVLSKKGQTKGWLEGLNWSRRWFVLHSDRLDYYENPPMLASPSQVRVQGCTIHCFRVENLFRFIFKGGSTLEMRVPGETNFKERYERFAHIGKAKLHKTGSGLKRCPNALVLLADAEKKEMIGGLHIRIEGHQVIEGEKGPYVAFIVHSSSPKLGTRILPKRFSEFRTLHQKLREIFPHEQVPPLPHTRLWNKLDPHYLKSKSVHLQGYLEKINALCVSNRGTPLLMEFLREPDGVPGSKNHY